MIHLYQNIKTTERHIKEYEKNRIEICIAFGLHIEVVGEIEVQTYSNYKDAIKAFEGSQK